MGPHLWGRDLAEFHEEAEEGPVVVVVVVAIAVAVHQSQPDWD